MFLYIMKIKTKQYKADEFATSADYLVSRIAKDKSCVSYSLTHDPQAANTFSVVGQWDSRQAMEKHFKTLEFELLYGATMVLGQTFEIQIAEIFEAGGGEIIKKYRT